MLTAAGFADLRRREFAYLDAADETYLDFTGAALAADSLVVAPPRGALGNPHSTHLASRRSTDLVEQARTAVLEHFHVDQATHEVCFTANASAALKLVGESFPFDEASRFVLTADNHNSVNGIREFARRARARTELLTVTDDLRAETADLQLRSLPRGPGLFAFPAQSNFSGVLHPLALVDVAHAAGLEVLLDAAAFAPTHALDLRACQADFVAVSFYKMFGYPTGVGALVAKKAALDQLRRPWFAGGTVDFVSVQLDRHQHRAGHESFEDGTPNFLALAAIPSGLRFLASIGMDAITAHVDRLTEQLLLSLQSLRHPNGAPVVAIYGPANAEDRGGTVAFNLLDATGVVVPYETVEHALSERGIYVRGGCFCNPGAAEAAFGFDARRTAECLTRLGRWFRVDRFARCLGRGATVGALRASLGIPTTRRDIGRLVAAVIGLSESWSTPGADWPSAVRG